MLCSIISISAAQKEAVRQVVLDYAESYYTGEFERAANSIHPDFRKASAAVSEITGEVVLTYFSHSQLIETTRSKKPVEKSKIPAINIDILKLEDNYANVKIKTPDFFDYALLVKINDQWKLMNVVSTPKTEAIKNDETKIYAAVEMYKEGILGGDAKRLEMSILPGFSNARRITDQNTNKTRIVRTGYESAIDNSLNKAGMVDELMRDCRITVMDANEKLALVELVMPFSMEYLQLFKGSNGWKVFNAFRKRNPEYSFDKTSPVYLEEQIPDFTLPVYKGGKFTMSENKGKKTMLIFLRGWIGQIWCPLCQYQYLELAELDKINKWREKYNMDIYFVLPYSEERINDWFNSFNRSMNIINGWRNLEGFERFSGFVNKFYPMKFENLSAETKVPITFPILTDADKTVSKQFKLNTNFWDGVKADQNVSTIFIVDEEGVVQFKYFSQQTQDRPTYNYLMKFVENM